MFIAVLVAADTACRVTITKLAATFVVPAAGAELRAVEGGKQSSAAHLPRDRAQSVLRTRGARGGALPGVLHPLAPATIPLPPLPPPPPPPPPLVIHTPL